LHDNLAADADAAGFLPRFRVSPLRRSAQQERAEMSPAKVAAQTNKEIEFPTWIPQGAQRRIAELSATPGLDNEYHALLERLSKYPAMKTEVWEKLPSTSKGFEHVIIEWAFSAFTIFPHLPRPYPKTKPGMREWAIHIKQYPPIPDPSHIAGLAYILLERIVELKAVTDSDWSRLWGGDKSITSDDVLAILDQLRLFYLRFNNEHQTRLAKLPKIKRWSKKAWQKFFTEYLSKRFKETYLQPCDSTVAALAEVAFDLPSGVAAETIRGRRRTVHRKNRRKNRA
jgi:hypothetical protein